MPAVTTTLTDVAREIWLDRFSLPDTPGPNPWSIRKRTLHGGPGDGVDVVDLDNGALSLSVLPTRGLGIWKGRYRGIPLGWKSPVIGPVHPRLVEQSARNGLGWLTGFDEWACRCGLAWMGAPGDDNGFPLTLHGRIANTPAHRVDVAVDPEAQLLSVFGRIEEGGLFYPHLQLTSRLTTKFGSNAFTMVDVVENRSAQPAEYQLLYHINNGPPLLTTGSVVRVPVKEVTPMTAWAAEGLAAWNTCQEPVAGFAERVYACVPAADAQGRTLAVLHDAAAGLALTVRWSVAELPYFTLWKNTAAIEDGYVVGLEPATSFPRPRPFERANGRVPRLAPGESRSHSWTVEVHDSRDSVAAAVAEVERIQVQVPPVLHGTPLS